MEGINLRVGWINFNGVYNYPSYKEFGYVDCIKVIFNHLYCGIGTKCLYEDPVYKEFNCPNCLTRVFKEIGYWIEIGEVDEVNKIVLNTISFSYFTHYSPLLFSAVIVHQFSCHCTLF